MARPLSFLVYLALFMGLVIAVHSTPKTEELLKCRDGWSTYENACYLFHSIRFPKDVAEKTCKSQSSALLSLETEKERQWLESKLANVSEVESYLAHKTRTDDSFLAQEPDTSGETRNCAVLTGDGSFRMEVCTKLAMAMCKQKKETANSACRSWVIANTGDYCIFGYYTKLNWKDARAACQRFNADLLSIKDNDELQVIQDRLITGRHGNWWTGLQFDTTSKKYVFSDKTPYSKDIVPWLKTEQFGDDDCSAFLSNGKLVEVDCDDVLPFICKHHVMRRKEQDCPDYWVRAGNSCYYANTMKRLNWTAAQSDCKSKGAHLLKVDSVDEKAWLETTGKFYLYSYWTGLNAIAKKGAYEWDDGTKLNTSLIVWDKYLSNHFDCSSLSPTTKTAWHEGCYASGSLLACEYNRQRVESNCADGWISNGPKCYLLPNNRTSYNYVNWYQNKISCLRKHSNVTSRGHYITIENQDELTFVTDTLKQRKIRSHIWLGLNKIKDKKSWVWEDAPDVPGSTVAFRTNEPDTDFKCVFYYDYGFYATNNCSNTNAYICEKMLKVKPGSSSFLAPGLICVISLLLACLTTFY